MKDLSENSEKVEEESRARVPDLRKINPPQADTFAGIPPEADQPCMTSFSETSE